MKHFYLILFLFSSAILFNSCGDDAIINPDGTCGSFTFAATNGSISVSGNGDGQAAINEATVDGVQQNRLSLALISDDGFTINVAVDENSPSDPNCLEERLYSNQNPICENSLSGGQVCEKVSIVLTGPQGGIGTTIGTGRAELTITECKEFSEGTAISGTFTGDFTSTDTAVADFTANGTFTDICILF